MALSTFKPRKSSSVSPSSRLFGLVDWLRVFPFQVSAVDFGVEQTLLQLITSALGFGATVQTTIGLRAFFTLEFGLFFCGTCSG
jgi:hypothetical protein